MKVEVYECVCGVGGDSLDHCLPVGLPAGVRLGGVQRNAAMLMIPHVRACDAQIHIASVTAIVWSWNLPPPQDERVDSARDLGAAGALRTTLQSLLLVVLAHCKRENHM